MKFYAESSSERAQRVLDMGLPGSEPQYRFLLIGAGMIGREHIAVTQLLGKAQITGIYDPHQDSIEQALALFAASSGPQPTIHSSLDTALNETDAHAILICTPNYTHFEIVQQAIKTGLPLFVEKPMATSLSNAAQLVQIARDYPGFIQLGMQYRFKSQYIEAFREVKLQQSLGKLATISMSEYRPPFLDKVNQWNKFNEYSGGTLVEKCCHYFDLINLMAESRPVSVYASGGQAVNFLDFEYQGKTSDIHDHGFVIINYENGIRASFTLNMFAQELFEELVVCGQQGRLIATENSSFRTAGSRGQIKVELEGHPDYDWREVTYPQPVEGSGHHGATFFEHEGLIAQLSGQPADCATVEQGLWAMIVASAAQESVTRQQVVSIESFLGKMDLDWVWREYNN